MKAHIKHEHWNNEATKIAKKRMKALRASNVHEKRNNKAGKKLLKKKDESITLGAFTVKAPQNSLMYMRKLAIFM